MRRRRFTLTVCSLLALTLLAATSQYLAHFHLPRVDVGAAAGPHADNPADHAAQESCNLCLQFDRLPAPPALQRVLPATFFLVATLEAERLERIALATPQLWPPSRAPPSLAC